MHDEDRPREWADFYLGPPQEGEYLGSTQDGHPDALMLWDNFQSLTEAQFGEVDYRQAVAELVEVTSWPHGHDTSSGTPWAYCWMPAATVEGKWKPGLLVVHHYGRRMAEIVSNLFYVKPGERADAPRMRPGSLFTPPRRKVGIR